MPWQTEDTKVSRGFHVFNYHPNVTFTTGVHLSDPLFIICHLRKIRSATAFFKIKSYFQQTILAAHHCQDREKGNIFKMAKLIRVPRLTNGRVPSEVDNHSPRILLLLLLLLCLPIFDSLIFGIPLSSLPTFWKVLTKLLGR